MKRCYEFGPDQIKAINSLATELGIDKTDVLHTGLRLLCHAVREVRRGNGLGVVREDRVVGRLIGVWDEAKEQVPA